MITKDDENIVMIPLMWLTRKDSQKFIPIWEDWKLTAKYAADIERSDTTTGIQMFDRLDDDEKIRALIHAWFLYTRGYIIKYFREHPELLERARRSLKREEIHSNFIFV